MPRTPGKDEMWVETIYYAQRRSRCYGFPMVATSPVPKLPKTSQNFRPALPLLPVLSTRGSTFVRQSFGGSGIHNFCR